MANLPPSQLILFLTLFSSLGADAATKIRILHWNDINGQIQQILKDPPNGPLPTPCKDAGNLPNCEGGIENLLYRVSTTATSSPVDGTVTISTGNLVGGENGWLSSIDTTPSVTQPFLNGWQRYGALVGDYYGNSTFTKVPHFIHTYGLKEFEAGLSRTLDYHRAHNVSITLANVVCPATGSAEQEFCGIVGPASSVVKPLYPQIAEKVGVVGFINPNVEKLSSPGALKFVDVITSLQSVAASWPHKSLIAIGDGSLDLAQRILDSVPKVKLVIYGRALGSSSNMSDQFPRNYKGKWIVSAGRYGVTLGDLVVTLNDAGDDIATMSGRLIKTSHDSQAKGTIKEVGVFSGLVEKKEEHKIGQAIFRLEGGSQCWRNECNLGNLVADAMVHCAYNNSKVVTGSNRAIVGVWHGGALFDDVVQRGDNISEMDIHRWLPYHNRVHLVKITGSSLMAMFGISGSGIYADVNSAVQDWGQFLQVSNGLEVYYKTNGGSPKVERIRILNEDNNTPKMVDVVPSQSYNLVVPSFLREGRNLYWSAKEWFGTDYTDVGFDDECLFNYVNGLKKVTVGFEERIYIDDFPGGCSTTIKKGGNTAVTVILTIVFMALILGIAYVGYFYVYPKLAGRHPTSSSYPRNQD